MPILDHSDLERVDGEEPMFIVMPYAGAGSLEKRAKMYADSLDSTLKVAMALAKALAHAHAATPPVIHRDLKPPNILFMAEDHNPLLADFGICLIADRPRVTEQGEVVGPWAFMAPELDRRWSTRSDRRRRLVFARQGYLLHDIGWRNFAARRP
jgi:serine/threonine protein kinase